ncbi:MAG: hypothetical protein N2485_08150 [bacterium]|nr:hypothetical protein [bacterium]
MPLENALKLDSIIFIITCIYICINIYFNEHRNKKNIFFLIMFFIIINSSYNIMIKKIHDFNIPITRNFIYFYEILWKFSLLDIVFIFLFVFNLKYIVNSFISDKLSFLIFKKEFLLYLISSISFIINKGYFLDNGLRFLTLSKGVLYFSVSYYFFKKNQYFNKNHIKYFFIILISGYISLAFFNIDDIWIRYGNRVTIIDQEDAYSISNFLILYYLVNYLEKKEFKDIVLFLLVLFQNIISMYKTNFIIIPLLIMFYIVIFYQNRNNKNLKVLTLVMSILLFVLIIIINYDMINGFVNSVAIKTRWVQLTSFLNNLDNNYKIFFGLGHGTPYFSIEDTSDYGEIKIIDKIYNGYRFDIQTPLINIIKYAGFVGFIIYMYYNLKIVYLLFNKKKSKINLKTEEKVVWLYFLVYIFILTNFINGNPPDAIFNAYISSLVYHSLYSK